MNTIAEQQNSRHFERTNSRAGAIGKPEAIEKLIVYCYWLFNEIDEALRLGLTSTAAIRPTRRRQSHPLVFHP